MLSIYLDYTLESHPCSSSLVSDKFGLYLEIQLIKRLLNDIILSNSIFLQIRKTYNLLELLLGVPRLWRHQLPSLIETLRGVVAWNL